MNSTSFKMNFFLFINNVPNLWTLISQQLEELERCSFFCLKALFLLYGEDSLYGQKNGTKGHNVSLPPQEGD